MRISSWLFLVMAMVPLVSSCTGGGAAMNTGALQGIESLEMNLVERRFRVQVPVEDAWAHLERVEQWPSWARHIRKVELRPSGPLGPDSEGALELTHGIRSTFRVEELNTGSNWMWVGPFLWLAVHYDHQFKRTSSGETEIGFVLDGEGFGVRVFGRFFAAIYARNLDKAIPNLIQEMEHGGSSGQAG